MGSNRRDFVKKTIAGAIGIATISIPEMANATSLHSKKTNTHNLNLAVASYSLREFSTKEALDMTLRCGVNRIAFKSMHLPLDSNVQTITDTLKLCDDNGIILYGGGVIYMKTRGDVDQAFEYAKAANMEVIIGVPNHELLAYVEEKVKAYDIKLAIHNHGPGDDLYPSAESAYNLIKDMDSRMGLCIDIGHTKRINRNPEQDVTAYFDRVFDIHMKDVTAANKEGKSCIIGRGVIDIPAFLKVLVALEYSGNLALEYEVEANDPLPGMTESMGYLKGVLVTI